MQERDKFQSRFGFIMVSAGCAIGLGNVWKFPYICGENGGAAFIMIYLLFLAVLGWPILMAEFAVGRGSRRSIAQSFSILESEKSNWHCFKWFGIAGNYLLMMFYTMVTGWMMYYAWLAVSGQLEANSKVQSTTEQFADMLANPGTMILWTVIAIAIAFGICALGLQNGVEKVTKVMMLLLITLMIVLAVNFMESILIFLKIEFQPCNVLFIQIVGGLIQKQHITGIHQSPCQCHPFLLSPG